MNDEQDRDFDRDADEPKAVVAHTPEPWEAIKLDGYPHSRIIAPNHEGHCRFVYDAGGVGAHADMSRAVQCVNALAGIADPDALVKSHGELVRALERIAFEPIGHAESTYGEIVHGMTEIARTALANAPKPPIGETK